MTSIPGICPHLVSSHGCHFAAAASHYDGIQGDVSYTAPSGRPPPPPNAAPAPAPAPAAGPEDPCGACDTPVPMTTSQRHVIGFITEWITAYRYVSGTGDGTGEWR